MARQIYIVNAYIVDSNGTFNVLTGYPKSFDSRNYNDNVDKALQRAEGEFHDTIGTICKRDDRQIQTVTISDVTGFMIEKPFTIGSFAEPNA